ncbi:hypothetical protein [Flavitalea sp.]|nr:hypothetical protein [Flavitalea sp.]
MKIFTKILIGVLIVTTLIPIYIGILCLIDQSDALQFFSVKSLSADLEKLFFVLGGFMLASAVMPVLAIVWIIKRKTQGFTLAYIVGFIAFARGILTMINFNVHNIVDNKLTATPLAIGALILIITFIATRKEVKYKPASKLPVYN